MLSRIAKYIDYKGISVRAFESSIGASDGMIRRAIKNNTDIQGKWLKNIADIYHDINLVWLVTGEGEMLKSDFSAEDKKNEHQDKKKCHDTQNNFNEKNASPLNEIYTKENASPLDGNASPICKPNSKDETFPVIPKDTGVYHNADVQEERFMALLEGGGVKEILNLKDAIISSQKSHIMTLEVQLKDFRRNNEMLRQDCLDLKKEIKELTQWLQEYEECVNYEAVDGPKKHLKDSAPVSAAVVAQPKR